jgi:WD40 repeat protein
VCFSPDGKYLATSAFGGHIYASFFSSKRRSHLLILLQFWEIRKKHVRNVFKGHVDVIHSLNFSPNGRHLVSASDDNTVRLWNVHDGTVKVLREDNPLLLDMPHYRSAIFSPDGRYVAAPHRDGMVRIWCVRTGRLMRRMKTYTKWVHDIAFMPDGKSLVSARRDETLKHLKISSLTTTSLRAVNNLHEYGSDTEEHTPSEGPIETMDRYPRCDHARWQMDYIRHGVKYPYLGYAQHDNAMHPQDCRRCVCGNN